MSLMILATVDALLDKEADYISDRIAELRKEDPEITPRAIAEALVDELDSDEKRNAILDRDSLISGFEDDEAATSELVRYLSVEKLQEVFNDGVWRNFDGHEDLFEALLEKASESN